MHKPFAATDFKIPLDGVGDFTFARRTLGDAITIRGEYLRLLGGHGDGDPEMEGFSNVVATIKTLCVDAPEGWEDIEKLDIVSDDKAFVRVLALFDALKEKEDSFRGQTAREGTA